jgi:hypothetical protein
MLVGGGCKRHAAEIPSGGWQCIVRQTLATHQQQAIITTVVFCTPRFQPTGWPQAGGSFCQNPPGNFITRSKIQWLGASTAVGYPSLQVIVLCTVRTKALPSGCHHGSDSVGHQEPQRRRPPPPPRPLQKCQVTTTATNPNPSTLASVLTASCYPADSASGPLLAGDTIFKLRSTVLLGCGSPASLQAATRSTRSSRGRTRVSSSAAQCAQSSWQLVKGSGLALTCL